MRLLARQMPYSLSRKVLYIQQASAFVTGTQNVHEASYRVSKIQSLDMQEGAATMVVRTWIGGWPDEGTGGVGVRTEDC